MIYLKVYVVAMETLLRQIQQNRSRHIFSKYSCKNCIILEWFWNELWQTHKATSILYPSWGVVIVGGHANFSINVSYIHTRQNQTLALGNFSIEIHHFQDVFKEKSKSISDINWSKIHQKPYFYNFLKALVQLYTQDPSTFYSLSKN